MLDFGAGIDPTVFKSGLRVLHFLGLALGLGTATFLDMMMVRFMIRGKIRGTHWLMLEFGSRMVTAGLVMLWVSGVGFLLWYGLFEPKNLTNEKIWAKISIVAVLTINGHYLHGVVLPIFRDQVGRGLFEGISAYRRNLMVAGGVTSVVSWYFPVAIAASPWLNFNVPMGYIAGTYAAVLLVGLVLALAAVTLFFRALSAPIAAYPAGHLLVIEPHQAEDAALDARHVAHYRSKYRAEVAQKRRELEDALEKFQSVA